MVVTHQQVKNKEVEKKSRMQLRACLQSLNEKKGKRKTYIDHHAKIGRRSTKEGRVFAGISGRSGTVQS